MSHIVCKSQDCKHNFAETCAKSVTVISNSEYKPICQNYEKREEKIENRGFGSIRNGVAK